MWQNLDEQLYQICSTLDEILQHKPTHCNPRPLIPHSFYINFLSVICLLQNLQKKSEIFWLFQKKHTHWCWIILDEFFQTCYQGIHC